MKVSTAIPEPPRLARSADQHLVVLGHGRLHLGEPKDVGRSISGVDNGLHGLGPPTAADLMLANPVSVRQCRRRSQSPAPPPSSGKGCITRLLLAGRCPSTNCRDQRPTARSP